MVKKIVAIVGSYRRDGTIEHAVDAILQAAADGLILASPVNFFGVTAVTQRFMERLVCYAFWPWGNRGPSQG